MAEPLEYPIRMDGAFEKDALILLVARIDEGVNQVTRIDIEFAKADGTLDIDDLIGTDMTVTVEMPNAEKRVFPGVFVRGEFLGTESGREHFQAEIRPWFWFLGRTQDSRIYQETNVPDLFQTILGEYGFSGDLEKRLTGTYPSREYILQYRESDLDFLIRIAEEEGIYFYFVEKNGRDCLVLADNTGAHSSIEGDEKIPFRPRDNDERFQIEHFYRWSGGLGAPSGLVTLGEYNFERPNADMKVASAMPKGKHAYKNYEVYSYPGKYWETSEGERYAKFKMQAEAISHHLVKGRGPVPRMRPGHNFKLIEHSRKSENREYTVLRALHQLSLYDYEGARLSDIDVRAVEAGMSNVVSMEAAPAAEQYRPRAVIPKPVVTGIQTATVVGPGGEIHTDQYGRVKVKFHWDREGKADGGDSCWVRVATPWAGKNWGMIHIPRMGQEVVVDFEEGDPDRPIIVGMLYNASNMPPYPLDADKTKSGIKTNSSEGGGGFNELVFEDKKGAEYVRMQSEKNYLQIVKNNARVDVGNDLVQSVGSTKTEFVKYADTQLVGLLKDIAVGGLIDEKVGAVKSQFVGVYKEEKVGIGKKDFSNATDIMRMASVTAGPASTLSDEIFGTSLGSAGQAITAVNALVSARTPGKNEEIYGLSRLEVNGDREQIIQKARGKLGEFKTTVKDGPMYLHLEKGDCFVDIDEGAR
ncbi:MAG: type VI secretion system tip protein TssI/VgrG, partial [Pseudomonadota bacterium]